jgi:hypothetical protein
MPRAQNRITWSVRQLPQRSLSIKKECVADGGVPKYLG